MAAQKQAARKPRRREPIALIPAFREASDRRRDEMTVSERFADARAQVERNERRGRAYYGQKDIESRLRGILRRSGDRKSVV